jgi:hypothetical protein
MTSVRLELRSIHLYGGWFLFCGELIEGVDELPENAMTAFAHWFIAFFPTGTVSKDLKDLMISAT